MNDKEREVEEGRVRQRKEREGGERKSHSIGLRDPYTIFTMSPSFFPGN